MGRIYKHINEYITTADPNQQIVEIGSDRYEGSSAYLAELAVTLNTKFVSVDFDTEALQRARRSIPAEHRSRCTFVCAEAVDWTANYDSSTADIVVLYLDNFDWNWQAAKPSAMILEQQKLYQDKGLVMDNWSCQLSHLQQCINLLPCMSEQSVIAIDDTYLYNGTYTGKGAAAMAYLTCHGYQLLQVDDYGVILGRNIKNSTV
jgi:hypothetical protein